MEQDIDELVVWQDSLFDLIDQIALMSPKNQKVVSIMINMMVEKDKMEKMK